MHGHFYQPPRENPWLEAIEPQESAYPYPNWNERILAECYRPNAAARIINDSGQIIRIINNYEYISFNFGPTLLSWLAQSAPDVHQAIIDADRKSSDRFSGHGSALAQTYNHSILPLCNIRDKYTQAHWGLRDFEHHFGRRPEGMWLPETAVDNETLGVLADLDVDFTILAPHQAVRIRPLGSEHWQDVSGGRIPTHRAYRASLPGGKSINLFFYDGPMARAVAFERLLSDGQSFAARLVGAPYHTNEPVLRHIATDGETYGHHHRHGDMALAYALSQIGKNDDAKLTNYGEFLALAPPTYEVEIAENTAWSCAHGVERWRSNCGCNSGSHSWSQQWRSPLRESLDWLREEASSIYETEAAPLLNDPWEARNAYIDVVLNRNDAVLKKFLSQHGCNELPEQCTQQILELLELQRHAMLMYTSCGWFFDDISGTEAVQVLAYAARAVELAEKVSGSSLEAEFLQRLSAARSNIPQYQDGRRVYETFVKPARIDLSDVVAHYAVNSLFDEDGQNGSVYSYATVPQDTLRRLAGDARLVIGTLGVTSKATTETTQLSYAALHLGDHNLTGGIRRFKGDAEFWAMADSVADAFDSADLVVTQREIGKHFGGLSFSLSSLFRLDRDRISNFVLAQPSAEAEDALRLIYDDHVALMRYLVRHGIAIPRGLTVAAKFAVNRKLRRALEQEEPSPDAIRAGFDEAERLSIALDAPGLEYAWQGALERMSNKLAKQPHHVLLLRKLVDMATLAQSVTFPIDLWRVQNECYALVHSILPERCEAAKNGDVNAVSWTEAFTALAEPLRVYIPPHCELPDT